MSGQNFRIGWYRFRATLARQLTSYLTVVLLIGLIGGVGMASLAGARRTQSSYPQFLASTNPSDLTMAVYGIVTIGHKPTSLKATIDVYKRQVHTSITNCAQTPYNFQPEYNTASANNIIPWAALQTDISTEFETGHFEPCSSLTTSLGVNPFDPADPDGTLGECVGKYETGSSSTETNTEPSDAMCYHAGDTHQGFNGPGTSTAPDLVTGCEDNYTQNGDLDFDGTPYWPEWPTSTQPGLYPGSFVEQLPSSGGRNYSSYFFQTDIALSETSCTPTTLSGCTVPPAGPGGFYPFWSLTSGFGGCALEFGNVTRGFNVNDFGGDVQYGTNKFNSLGYPEFEGPLHSTNCGYGQGGGFNSDISQRSTS